MFAETVCVAFSQAKTLVAAPRIAIRKRAVQRNVLNACGDTFCTGTESSATCALEETVMAWIAGTTRLANSIAPTARVLQPSWAH